MSSVSNVTGVAHPWEDITEIAHQYGHTVCVDFSQSIAHDILDILSEPVDWAVFGGHKMYGPTGVGVLYSAADPGYLKPLIYGGGPTMVDWTKLETVNNYLRHESGTQNIAGIIGIGEAAQLLNYADVMMLNECERTVSSYLRKNLGILNIDLYDVVKDSVALDMFSHGVSGSILSLTSDKFSVYDIGQLLAQDNIAVRTGFMCAHPIGRKVSQGKGILRVSVAPYTTLNDCDRFLDCVSSINKLLN